MGGRKKNKENNEFKCTLVNKVLVVKEGGEKLEKIIIGLAVSSVMEGLVVSTMDSKFSFLDVGRRMPINSIVGCVSWMWMCFLSDGT